MWTGSIEALGWYPGTRGRSASEKWRAGLKVKKLHYHTRHCQHDPDSNATRSNYQNERIGYAKFPVNTAFIMGDTFQAAAEKANAFPLRDPFFAKELFKGKEEHTIQKYNKVIEEFKKMYSDIDLAIEKTSELEATF